MKYINTNLRMLERDILTGRISFNTGMDNVPEEEKMRFMFRLNRLISEERMKSHVPDRLKELETLDGKVSAALEALS